MASAYLSRTNGTETTRTKATVSFWIKYNGKTSTTCVIASSTDGNSTFYFLVEFKPDLDVQIRDGSGSVYLRRRSNAKYRDVNGWYHVVVSFDSTLGTADDRLKVYVNGERITSFSDNTGTVGSNYNCPLFKTNSPIRIGSDTNGGNNLEGCLTHFHATDGTAYDADTFGETDSTTGIWKPKTSPSVTYGTNGFFLDFADSSAMGNDVSGNNNDLTVSGTITQTIDTPSNVFATLNPLNVPSANAPTFANGNTKSTTPGSTGRFGGTSTLGMSKGKYYWEAKYVITGLARGGFGITYDPGEQARNNTTASNYADCWEYQSESGYVRNNNSVLDTEATYANGDIVMCALDLDNNYVYFGKNGTWINSGDPTSGSSGTGGYAITADETYFTITSDNTSGSDQQTYEYNFGNGYFGTTAVSSAGTNAGVGTFEYDVPNGYKALCTKSINEQEYS